MNIHPTAIVHPDAKLADDVEVQAYSIVGAQVSIGAGTVVGPHCVIEGDTTIGERNRFFSGAQIGVLSQDLKHDQALPGRASIGNDNTIREFVTFTASTMTSEAETDRVTSLGNNCLLMAYVHVGHDCHLGNHVVAASYAGFSGHVDVEDYANLAGFAGLHQDVCVGRYSFAGGMSRVTKDAPPYMIVEGYQSRCIGPNTISLQRHGFSDEARARIKQMYKIMFRSQLNTAQALVEIERSVDDCEERSHFLDFVRKSKRGIIKY